MTRDEYADMLMSAQDADETLDDLDTWAQDEAIVEQDDELKRLISVAQISTGNLVDYILRKVSSHAAH